MKHVHKSFSGSQASYSQPSARVVDGKLILSLPHALTPVLWQMDLGQAKASALEVRSSGNAEGFSLVLKTPRGEHTEIAPFENKSQAIEALMAVSRALESAQGHIRPAISDQNSMPAQAPREKRRRGGKWLAVLLGLILFFILMGVWGSMIPRPPSGLEGTSLAPVAGGRTSSSDTSGVPLSADEFLGNQ